MSNWAQRQRECEKASKLTDERKRLLDDLGFPWDPKKSRWDTMYQELLKYKQEVGDCDVPKVNSCPSLFLTPLQKLF